MKTQSDVNDDKKQQELGQWRQLQAAKFKAADVNGDGFVDMAELPALVFPKAHDHVMHVVVQDAHRQKDANNDGTVTKQEFQEGVFGGKLDEASAEVADADFAKL